MGSRHLRIRKRGSGGEREQRQRGMNIKVGEGWWEQEHGEFRDEK